MTASLSGTNITKKVGMFGTLHTVSYRNPKQFLDQVNTLTVYAYGVKLGSIDITFEHPGGGYAGQMYYTEHPYANNVDDIKELSYPGAEGLVMSIMGELAYGDYILITDSTGIETKYTGLLHATISNLPGDHVTVRFHSNDSGVAEGILVHTHPSHEVQPEGNTTYETGHPYSNNIDETQELSINGAEQLTVTINGEVEQGYDKIFITDSSGTETQYTGVLNKTFTVSGDHITVRFTSDYSVVKEGVTVHIE